MTVDTKSRRESMKNRSQRPTQRGLWGEKSKLLDRKRRETWPDEVHQVRDGRLQRIANHGPQSWYGHSTLIEGKNKTGGGRKKGNKKRNHEHLVA